MPKCVSHGLPTEVSRHQCVCKETCTGDLAVGCSTYMSMALFLCDPYSELHRRYESLWGAKINAGVAGLPGEFAFAAVIPGSCVFAVMLGIPQWRHDHLFPNSTAFRVELPKCTIQQALVDRVGLKGYPLV